MQLHSRSGLTKALQSGANSCNPLHQKSPGNFSTSQGPYIKRSHLTITPWPVFSFLGAQEHGDTVVLLLVLVFSWRFIANLMEEALGKNKRKFKNKVKIKQVASRTLATKHRILLLTHLTYGQNRTQNSTWQVIKPDASHFTSALLSNRNAGRKWRATRAWFLFY